MARLDEEKEKKERQEPSQEDLEQAETLRQIEELGAQIVEFMKMLGDDIMPRVERASSRRLRWFGQYILNERHQPVAEPDMEKWADWCEQPGNRCVAQDYIAMFHVSTVFLGIDPVFIFGDEGELHIPHGLFETMVFSKVGPMLGVNKQKRCNTWDEALAQHKETCDEIRKALAG